MRGWGCKAQTSFFCGTFRFGWVFPTQEPGFLFRVLLPFIFPSMVFIVFVTFCVLVRNPLPYDSIGCLHSHLQQSTWNQKVHRRQSTHCRIYFTPHDLTDTENMILKKKMAALEKRRVRAVHAHAFRGVRQPACAMSRQSVAQLWCFFNTAAVHFLRHVDYPWFQLSVSTQHVCSKQHVMLRTMPV